MHIVDVVNCDRSKVETDGAKDVEIQWLLAERECDAPNFAMRRFVVKPGGHTPRHCHPWEHEVYIVRGVGEVVHGDEVTHFAPDTAFLLEPNEEHQIRNTGVEPLEFLCMVPNGPATER